MAKNQVVVGMRTGVRTAQGDDGPNLEVAAGYDGMNVSGWASAWSMH